MKVEFKRSAEPLFQLPQLTRYLPNFGGYKKVGKAIRVAGPCGLTDVELAERVGMDRYSIEPRTSEPGRKGFILDSGRRRKNASGKLAIVWICYFDGTTTRIEA